MAGICVASVSPNACSHWTHTVVLKGVPYTIERDRTPLSSDELQRLLEFAARYLEFEREVLPSAFLHRVLFGEEATNVKIYTFFGPGAVLTKTNIGTTYVDICPGQNGERVVVDLTGCTEYRLMLSANLVGTGPWSARVVRDSDDAVLHDAPTLGAAGEREADTDWQPLPAAFLGQSLLYLRAQAKSQTATDDPVFRRLQLGLR
jgi:hypothetical protein